MKPPIRQPMMRRTAGEIEGIHAPRLKHEGSNDGTAQRREKGTTQWSCDARPEHGDAASLERSLGRSRLLFLSVAHILCPRATGIGRPPGRAVAKATPGPPARARLLAGPGLEIYFSIAQRKVSTRTTLSTSARSPAGSLPSKTATTPWPSRSTGPSGGATTSTSSAPVWTATRHRRIPRRHPSEHRRPWPYPTRWKLERRLNLRRKDRWPESRPQLPPPRQLRLCHGPNRRRPFRPVRPYLNDPTAWRDARAGSQDNSRGTCERGPLNAAWCPSGGGRLSRKQSQHESRRSNRRHWRTSAATALI